AINDYARKSNLFKEDDDNLTGDDVREGMTAIVSIKHTDPQFEGQTKTKLGNNDARTVTEGIFNDAFSKFLFENPVTGKTIVEKVLIASLVWVSDIKTSELTSK